VLVVPEHRIPVLGARIMDLQEPTRKMSTTGGSIDGTVYVLDEPDAIVKKMRRAVTDSGSEIVRSPEKPGVSNLIEILAVATRRSPEQVQADMAGARGSGDLKTAAAEAVIEMLAPVRERYVPLRADEQALEDVLRRGAEQARELAAQTLADVRERMGLGPARPPAARRRERSLP
jgi:tryptophanyl-tRNA synthetase